MTRLLTKKMKEDTFRAVKDTYQQEYHKKMEFFFDYYKYRESGYSDKDLKKKLINSIYE